MKKNNLSVIIVNFNSGGYLVKCLSSLERVSDELDLDIWVVDNASTDGSLDKAKQANPSVIFIANKENIGFTKANNLVLKKVKNEFILILNPDTEVLAGTLQYMINYLDNHKDVGAASCRVELADGSLDWASHRGFPTPWASFLYYVMGDDRLYHLTGRNLSIIHEVDCITGAFFLTRKSVLDQVGLFDEDYFMYAEDIDLCFRIKRAGYKIVYLPQVKIIHYKGVASGIKKHSHEISQATGEIKLKALNAFYETMKLFYRKNLSFQYFFFINWLVYGAINLKWALAKRKLHV